MTMPDYGGEEGWAKGAPLKPYSPYTLPAKTEQAPFGELGQQLYETAGGGGGKRAPIPADMMRDFELNRHLYDVLGKPYPRHYWWEGATQYSAPYDNPADIRVEYRGTETQQLKEAGATVVPGSVTPSGLTVVTAPADINKPDRPKAKASPVQQQEKLHGTVREDGTIIWDVEGGGAGAGIALVLIAAAMLIFGRRS